MTFIENHRTLEATPVPTCSGFLLPGAVPELSNEESSFRNTRHEPGKSRFGGAGLRRWNLWNCFRGAFQCSKAAATTKQGGAPRVWRFGQGDGKGLSRRSLPPAFGHMPGVRNLRANESHALTNRLTPARGTHKVSTPFLRRCSPQRLSLPFLPAPDRRSSSSLRKRPVPSVLYEI